MINSSRARNIQSIRSGRFIIKLFRELRKERTELEIYNLLMKVTGHSTLKALKAYLRDIDAELAEDYSRFLEEKEDDSQ